MLPFNYGPALNLNLKAKEEQNWPTGLKRDVGRQRLDNVCGDRKQPELKPEVDERRKDEVKSLSNVLEFSFRKLQLQSLCCVPSFRSESVIYDVHPNPKVGTSRTPCLVASTVQY